MYDYSFMYCIYDSNLNIYFFNLQMSLLQCICFMAVFSTLGRCIFFYLKIKLFIFNMIMCIIPQVQEIHSQLKKNVIFQNFKAVVNMRRSIEAGRAKINIYTLPSVIYKISIY